MINDQRTQSTGFSTRKEPFKNFFGFPTKELIDVYLSTHSTICKLVDCNVITCNHFHPPLHYHSKAILKRESSIAEKLFKRTIRELCPHLSDEVAHRLHLPVNSGSSEHGYLPVIFHRKLEAYDARKKYI